VGRKRKQGEKKKLGWGENTKRPTERKKLLGYFNLKKANRSRVIYFKGRHKNRRERKRTDYNLLVEEGSSIMITPFKIWHWGGLVVVKKKEKRGNKSRKKKKGIGERREKKMQSTAGELS